MHTLDLNSRRHRSLRSRRLRDLTHITLSCLLECIQDIVNARRPLHLATSRLLLRLLLLLFHRRHRLGGPLLLVRLEECSRRASPRRIRCSSCLSHRHTHEVAEARSSLVRRRRRKLAGEVRVLAENIVSRRHAGLEERIAHVAHETGACERRHEPQLRRHLSTVLILVVELLENLVKVLHILVNGLRPSVQLEVKRVKAAIHPFHARNDTDECLALEAERRLQLLRVHQAHILLLNLVEAVIHREAAAHLVALLLKTLELVEILNLLLLLLQRVPLRADRC